MHDEKNFPEPHRFNPYRVFTDRYKKAERDGLCLAFSNGKHKCPGEAMASNEVKLCFVMQTAFAVEKYPLTPKLSRPTELLVCAGM